MAFTNWLMAHGTSAKVQDPGAVGSLVYYGWGLDFNVLNPGTSVWVQVPVPTAMYVTLSRSIRIYFSSGSDGWSDVWIDQVDVWNGGTRVASFTGLKEQSIQYSGTNMELELSPPVDFESGMNLSILVTAGTNPDATSDQRRFILNGAGALFEQ
jgi:hypothetical protein